MHKGQRKYHFAPGDRVGPWRMTGEQVGNKYGALCPVCGALVWSQMGNLRLRHNCKSCGQKRRWSSEAVIRDPALRLMWRHRHRQMLLRCGDPSHPRYADYGGRGIRVHAALVDFEDFCRAIVKLPRWRQAGKQRLHLDREDNSGDYAPGNLRIVSCTVNANNRRPKKLKCLALEAGTTAGHWRFTGDTEERVDQLARCTSRYIAFRLEHLTTGRVTWARASRLREIGFV